MFSMVTVASSTRMPTASARPPSVMVLMVSPSRLSTMTEVRMESGMEMAMMSVLRQLPRKSRIISAGQRGRDDGLANHSGDRGAHKDRLIASGVILKFGRHDLRDARAAAARMPFTTLERGGVARS